MRHLRATLLAASVLAPSLAWGQTLPSPEFQSLSLGTLTGTLAARPANSATANTSLLSNSGLIWLGGATSRTYTNGFGNQTTWLGDQFGGGWQAADTYAQMEIISTPGSGIALALATRSSDNSASQSYTIYDYAESDGSVNGGPNRSSENAYFFAWNRHDAGITSGSHYAIGLEIDTENEEPLQDQGSYALGAGSFTSNLWLACGGDYTAVRTPTYCPAAISILSQDYTAGALFSKGIIFAQNSFVYTHGYTGNFAIMAEMPANGVLSWVVPTTGAIAGVVGSVATLSSNPMDMLFYNSGVEFTNSLGTPTVWLDPNGNLTAAEHLNAQVGAMFGTPSDASGVYLTLDSLAGTSKFITAESQGAAVAEFGTTGAVSGNNSGDDFYLWFFSDAGAAAATLNTPGSGYTGAAGTLTWSGPNCAVPPVLNVTANGGAITGISSVATAGSCTALPSATATTWTAGGGLTGGSGASFNLTPTSSYLGTAIHCSRATLACAFQNAYDSVANGVAAVGTNYATGYAIVDQRTVVTSGAGGVISLPACAAPEKGEVINLSGGSITLDPPGTVGLNGGAAGEGIVVPSPGRVDWGCLTSTTGYAL